MYGVCMCVACVRAAHRAILHHLQTGAKVSQADVAVHVQQHVVWLDISGERKEDREGEIGRASCRERV